MGKEKKHFVVLISNDEKATNLEVVSLNKAINDFKMKIEIDEDGIHMIIKSHKQDVKLRLCTGRDFNLKMMREHFKENIPLGVFDRDNLKHFNKIIEIVRSLSKPVSS